MTAAGCSDFIIIIIFYCPWYLVPKGGETKQINCSDNSQSEKTIISQNFSNQHILLNRLLRIMIPRLKNRKRLPWWSSS